MNDFHDVVVLPLGSFSRPGSKDKLFYTVDAVVDAISVVTEPVYGNMFNIPVTAEQEHKNNIPVPPEEAVFSVTNLRIEADSLVGHINFVEQYKHLVSNYQNANVRFRLRTSTKANELTTDTDGAVETVTSFIIISAYLEILA